MSGVSRIRTLDRRNQEATHAITRRDVVVTLTVDVHPDGLDGRGPEAVLGLAVVATSLGPHDLGDVQRLVEHAGVLEAVRHAAGRLGPPDLSENTKGKQTSGSDQGSTKMVQNIVFRYEPWALLATTENRPGKEREGFERVHAASLK